MFTARNDIACVALHCGHTFHKACADQWLKQNRTWYRPACVTHLAARMCLASRADAEKRRVTMYVRSPNCRQEVHYEAPSTSYDSYGRDVATDPNRRHTPTSDTHDNNVHWVRVVVVPCVSRRRDKGFSTAVMLVL